MNRSNFKLWTGKFSVLVAIFILISLSHSYAGYSTLHVLRWDGESNGIIESDGASNSYPDQLVYFEYTLGDIPTSVGTQVVQIDGNETVSSDATNPWRYNSDLVSENNYSTFKGNDALVADFKYGTWYVSRGYGTQGLSLPCLGRSCRSALFRPNADNINKLLSGETVTSTLKLITWPAYFTGSPTRSREITVTIQAPFSQGEIVARIAEDSIKTEVFEGGNATVQVELENAIPTSPISVEYGIADISATSGADYTEPTVKSVTFNAGETRKPISIPITDNGGVESIEQFRITLIEGTGYELRHAKKQSTVYIHDNYIPTITAPSTMCHVLAEKPSPLPSNIIEAYFSKKPSDIYQDANNPFDLELKFNDPDTDADTNAKQGRYMYVEGIDESGMNNHNFFFNVRAADTSNSRRVPSVGDYRGYMRYRLVPRPINSNWFDITTPCEFEVWYVDAFKPGITLSVKNNSVLEGGKIQLVATATPVPSRDVTVPITISDTSRLQNASNLSITIPAGQESETLDVNTQYMANVQDNDSITITASTSNRYWLDNSLSTQSVTIHDSDRPGIQFNRVSNDTLSEGDGSIRFNFSLKDQTVELTEDLTVNYKVIQGESYDFFASDFDFDRMATIPMTMKSSDIVVLPLHDDEIDEENGTVTVLLDFGDGYSISSTESENRLVFNVTDNDIPEITIASISQVNAGSPATVVLDSDIKPLRPMPVSYIAENVSGEYFDSDSTSSTASPATLTFTGTESPYTAEIRVATKNDPESEYGTISVTLQNDSANPANYLVGSPSSREFRVAGTSGTATGDEDTMVGVIDEGYLNLRFTLDTALGFTRRSCHVVQVSGDADIIQSFTSTDGYANVGGNRYAIRDFNADPDNDRSVFESRVVTNGTAGTVSFTLIDQSAGGDGCNRSDLQDYTPHPASKVVTQTFGLDGSLSGDPVNGGLPVIRATPTVTIETDYDSIVPGSGFGFTVTANPAPAKGETLAVAILARAGTNSSLAVSPLNSDNRIVIDDTGSARGYVQTETGSTGVAVVSLGANSGYRLGSGSLVSVPITAITILPEISISGPAAILNDGEVAEFTFSVKKLITTTADIGLKVGITETGFGDFVEDGVRYFRIPAGSTVPAIGIPVRDNLDNGSIGSIRAELQASAGYTLGAVTTAYADVRDDEGPAPDTVSVSAVAPMVGEGGNAQFKFTRTTTKAGPLKVYYELMEEGEVTDAGDGFVEILAGLQESPVVSILTTASSVKTPEAGVTLRVKSLSDNPLANYLVGATASAKVSVTEQVPDIAVRLTKVVDASADTLKLRFTRATAYVSSQPACLIVGVTDDSGIIGGYTHDVSGTATDLTPGTLANGLKVFKFTPAGNQSIHEITVNTVSNADGLLGFTLEPQVRTTGMNSDPNGCAVSDATYIPHFANRAVVETYGSGVIGAEPMDARPVVSITSPAAGSAGSGATEGHSFTFTVASTEAAPLAGIDVGYEITDASGVVDGSLTGTVSIQHNETDATATVMLNDSDIGPGVVVSVQLDEDPLRYRLKEGGESTTVEIKDTGSANSGKPNLAISGESRVVEGSSTTLTVSSIQDRTLAENEVEVSYLVSSTNGDGFLASGQAGVHTLTLGRGETSATIQVVSKADSPDGTDGTITVELLDGADYTLPLDKAMGTASMTVIDPPIVSLTGLPPQGATLGQSFTFEVTSTPAPPSPFDVRLSLSVPSQITMTSDPASAYVVDGTGTVTVPTAGSATVKVTTSKPVSQDNLEFSAAVRADSPVGRNYRVSTSDGSKTVSLKNNIGASPAMPRVRILAPAGKVLVDGSTPDPAMFTVRTHAAPSAGTGIMVRYMVTGDDGYISDSQSRTGILELTGQETSLSIETKNPDGDVDDGMITVTLLDGMNYTLDDVPNHEATAVATSSLGVRMYVGTEGTSSESADEGGSITVTVATTSPVVGDIAVNLSASVSTDACPVYFPTRTIVSAGSSTTTFSVSREQDTGYFGTCTVTLSTLESADYAVDSGNRMVSLTFRDDETQPSAGTPTISIFNIERDEESGDILVPVSVFPAPAAGRIARFNYAIAQGTAKFSNTDYDMAVDRFNMLDAGSRGDFVFQSAADNDIVRVGRADAPLKSTGTLDIPASSTGTFLRIAVADDEAYESDETFTITLSHPMILDASTNPPANTGENAALNSNHTVATITIRNTDPKPVISASDVTASEASEELTFSLELDKPAGTDVMVDFMVSSVGTAMSPADYSIQTSSPLTIEAGDVSGKINVTLIDDSSSEGSEHFDLILRSTNAELSSGLSLLLVRGTIVDSESSATRPDVTIAQFLGAGTVQADIGQPAQFTITASEAPSGVVDVRYMLSQTGDFVSSELDTGRVHVKRLDSSRTDTRLSIATQDPDGDDSDGTVTVTLLNGTGYTLTGSNESAMVTVTDDPSSLPSVSISNQGSSAVFEGDTIRIPVEVTLAAGESDTPIDVNVAVSQGADDDFLKLSDIRAHPLTGLTAQGNGMETHVLTVTTVQDAMEEEDGTVIFTLVESTEYVPGDSKEVMVRVMDDEAPTLPVMNISAVGDIDEGGDAVFIITSTAAAIGGATGEGLSVNITVKATDSFISGAPIAGPVTIQAVSGGLFQGVHRQPTVADTDDDGTDGEIVVALAQVTAGADYSLGENSSASVTVSDNDDDGTLPSVSIARSSAQVMEASGAMAEFNITATGSGSRDPFTVILWVSQQGDFLKTPTGHRAVSMVSGSGTLAEDIASDNEFESDGSVTARIVPSNAAYSIGEGESAKVSVSDDEALVSIFVGTEGTQTGTGTEGNAISATLQVTNTSGNAIDRTNGTLLSVALLTRSDPPNCLAGYPNEALIPNVASTARLNFSKVEDLAYSGDCVATVSLGTGIGYKPKTGEDSITLTFMDNEPEPANPEFSISDAVLEEGSGNMEFAVSLFPPLPAGQTATVDYAFTYGTATVEDFSTPPVNGTLTFTGNASATATDSEEGITLGTIIVPVLDDDLDEDDSERFAVTISNPQLTIGTGTMVSLSSSHKSAQGTITDDDSEPVATVQDEAAAESDGTLTFTVELDKPSGRDVTAIFRVLSGTADQGVDYELPSPSRITIPAGSMEGDFAVMLISDAHESAAENLTLNVNLINAVFPDGGLSDTVTGTITDLPLVWISADMLEVSGTDYIEYTVGSNQQVFGFVTLSAFEAGTATALNGVVAAGAGTVQQSFAIRQAGGMQKLMRQFLSAGRNATVRISIDEDLGAYTIDPGRSEIMVNVVNGNTLPMVSIAAKNSRTVMPAPAEFTLSAMDSANTGALTGDITVNVRSASDPMDFLTVPAQATVKFDDLATDTMADYTLATAGATAEGTVSVELLPGAGYRLGSTPASNTATVTVVDNELPTLFIARDFKDRVAAGAQTNRITEGHSFDFTITAIPSPAEPLTVNLVHAGSTVTIDPETIVVGTDGTASGTVNTGEVSTDTTLTLAIGNHPDGKYETAPENSLTALILDNNSTLLPVISIEPASNATVLTQSMGTASDAPFTIKSSTATGLPVNVNLFVEETGNFLKSGEGGSKTYSVTMLENEYRIETEDAAPAMNDPDSTFKVTVLDGAGYVLADRSADPNSTAELNVSDEAPMLPVATIAAKNPTVNEGSDAVFVFTLTPAPTPANVVSIRILVTETGNFLTDAAKAKTVVTSRMNPHTTTEESFDTETLNSVFDPDSEVTVRILADDSQSGPNYRLGRDRSATVTVLDQNTPTKDGTEPTISIIALKDKVKESDADGMPAVAKFQIQSDLEITKAGGQEVNITVTEGNGSFLENRDKGNRVVSLPMGSRSVIHAIEILSDSKYEVDADITVTIMDPTTSGEYVIADSPHHEDTVKVLDNDVPTGGISIVSASDSVEEGGFAEFQITVVPENPVNDTIVNLTLGHDSGLLQTSQVLDVANSEGLTENTAYPDFFATVPAGHRSTLIRVKTVDNDLDNANVTVTASLQSDPGYTLVSPTAAMVAVRDDEVPELSISPAALSITEGGSFEFTVTSDLVPHRELTIPVGSSVDGVAVANDMRFTISQPLTIAAGADPATVKGTVTTTDGFSADTTLVIGIEDSQDGSYSRSSASSLNAMVLFNDSPDGSKPNISITRNASHKIQAGGLLEFFMESTHDPDASLSVNLEVADGDDAYFDFTGNPAQVPFTAADNRMKRLALTTIDPNPSMDDPDRRITLTVVDGSDYRVADRRSVTFTWTDDLPEVTVRPKEPSVLESESVEFEFVADPAPAAPIQDVAITVRESNGSFLTADSLATMTIALPANSNVTELALPTRNDNGTVDSDSTVTVTITPVSGGAGAAYTVGSPSSAMVAVWDGNAPEGVSIVAVTDSVREPSDGTPANVVFRVRSDTTTQNTRTVNITISDGHTGTDGFLSDSDRGVDTVDIRPGELVSDSIELPIQSDDAYEANGRITVTVEDSTLTPGTPGHYVKAATNTSAFVTVLDDDVPAGGISIVELKGTYSETDGNAQFQVTSDNPVSADTTVVVTADDGAADYLGSPHVNPTIRAGESSAILSIPLDDDNVHEADGSITATIEDSTVTPGTPGHYVKAAIGTTANAAVESGDAVPQIAVDGLLSEYFEGETVVFEIKTADGSTVSSVDRAITVEITQTGDFFAAGDTSPRTSTVNLPAMSTNAESLEISTIADAIDETNGSVSVKIMDGAGYAHSSPSNTATVNVLDNDDDSLPSVSISAVAGSINKGESAGFKLSLPAGMTNATGSPLEVAIGISATGNFLSGAEGERILTIPQNGTESNVHMEATNPPDAMNGEDGEIVATIKSDTGNPVRYSVGAAHRATVAVMDNGLDNRPVVTVAIKDVTERDRNGRFTVDENSNSVAGGNGSFEVTLSIIPAPESGQTVVVDNLTAVNQEGNYSVNTDLEDVTFTDAVTSVDATVHLNNNDQYDGWGTIVVGFEDTSHYKSSPTASENNIQVTVRDDEQSSVRVSATVQSTQPVREGEDINVTLTATPVPAVGEMLDIEFAVAESGAMTGYFNDYSPKEIVLDNANPSKAFTISTNRLMTNDGNGEITIALKRGDGYEVVLQDAAHAAMVSKSVTVIDLPDTPTVSVSADSMPITEGQDAVFTITAFPIPTARLIVDLRVSQKGDYIALYAPTRVAINAGEPTRTVRIHTVDDFIDETVESGSITLTLTDATEGYAVSRFDSDATVTVNDDDEKTNPNATRYSVAGNVIMGILQESKSSPTATRSSDSAILPMVSISADGESVEEGEPVFFAVATSVAGEEELRIEVELSQSGEFISGPLSRNVVLEAGRTAAALKVETEDDNLAEDDGIVTASIRKGRDYQVGFDRSASVSVTDGRDREARRLLMESANQTVFSELAGLIGARSLDTATQRVTSAFSAGGAAGFKLGGNSSLPDFVRAGGEAVNDGLEPWQKVLGDSSFEFGLFPEEGAANPATVWGSGDFRELNANGTGAGDLDGDVFTGHLGFDTLFSRGMVAGLTASMYKGEITFDSVGNEELSYNTQTTGVHPYFGLESSDGSRFQVIAGYGIGKVGLNQNGYGTELLDSSYASFGASGNRLLYSSDKLLSGGTSELNLEGETWMASQSISNGNGVLGSMRTGVRHLRISTVGSHRQSLENGVSVSPSMSIGLREDGKRDQSFFGMEMGGGISVVDPYGYEASAKGEVLFADRNQIREWGMYGKFSYDLANDGLGILLVVTPEWGRRMPVAGNALWGDSVLVQDFDSSMHTDGARINAEIGYGLSVWEKLGILKPFGGLTLSETQNDTYRMGARLDLEQGMEFGLEGMQTLKSGRTGEYQFNLEGSIKW